MERLLSVAEAANVLGIKTGTLYFWVCRKIIPHVKLSSSVLRFREKDLEEFIAARFVSSNNSITAIPKNESPTAKCRHRKSAVSPVQRWVQSAKKEVLG